MNRTDSLYYRLCPLSGAVLFVFHSLRVSIALLRDSGRGASGLQSRELIDPLPLVCHRVSLFLVVFAAFCFLPPEALVLVRLRALRLSCPSRRHLVRLSASLSLSLSYIRLLSFRSSVSSSSFLSFLPPSRFSGAPPGLPSPLGVPGGLLAWAQQAAQIQYVSRLLLLALLVF